MYHLNSVDFNSKVKLTELSNFSETRIFAEWLIRINEYYVTPTKNLDANQNGFASLILQLCAIDALASFLTTETSVKKK